MSKFGGKRHYVYLDGAISEDKRTYRWREIFTDLVKHDDLVVLNPCDTLYNKKLHDNGSWDLRTVADSKGKNLLKAKDYKLIEISSLLIANLDYYTIKKPLIGTIMELDWSFKIFNIPVIIICADQENNPYCLHPWINHHAGAIVNDIYEAVDIVREFFV